MVVLNGRRKERRSRGHHLKNTRKQRGKRYNEFHIQEDSQRLKSIIIDHAPPSYGLCRDIVDVFPPEDELLLSDFSARHPGFLLSKETHPPKIRRSAYENFASFLKLLGSHSTIDLMTTLKPMVSARLDILKLYGFKGEWFDDLVRHLNRHTPDKGEWFDDLVCLLNRHTADEELQKVNEQEAACSQHIGGLEKEYEVLSRKLDELKDKIFVAKEKMDNLATRKKQIMKDRASLNFPYRY